MEKKSLITLPDLRQVARKMRTSGLDCIELRGHQWSVRMKYPTTSLTRVAPEQTMPAEPLEGALPADTHTLVTAMMPGRVLLCHPLHKSPFVQPGQRVKQHDLLALLKVNGLYLPVCSPVDGTVVSVALQQGDVAEYCSEIMKICCEKPV
jgi:acetyl-CoA carboxylase biotin carboxyl carrier protein